MHAGTWIADPKAVGCFLIILCLISFANSAMSAAHNPYFLLVWNRLFDGHRPTPCEDYGQLWAQTGVRSCERHRILSTHGCSFKAKLCLQTVQARKLRSTILQPRKSRKCARRSWRGRSDVSLLEERLLSEDAKLDLLRVKKLRCVRTASWAVWNRTELFKSFRYHGGRNWFSHIVCEIDSSSGLQCFDSVISRTKQFPFQGDSLLTAQVSGDRSQLVQAQPWWYWTVAAGSRCGNWLRMLSLIHRCIMLYRLAFNRCLVWSKPLGYCRKQVEKRLFWLLFFWLVASHSTGPHSACRHGNMKPKGSGHRCPEWSIAVRKFCFWLLRTRRLGV